MDCDKNRVLQGWVVVTTLAWVTRDQTTDFSLLSNMFAIVSDFKNLKY